MSKIRSTIAGETLELGPALLRDGANHRRRQAVPEEKNNFQETIYNFTTSNSPLPSNTVADITIDESTGSVFFATEKGLMEFNSNITSAADDLSSFKAFPNPVRPEYGEVNVTIQGLTSGANVKITDIEGNLVYEAQNESFDEGGSGTILWDTRSFNGNKVATGVYLLLITAEDMIETKIEKLLIVR